MVQVRLGQGESGSRTKNPGLPAPLPHLLLPCLRTQLKTKVLGKRLLTPDQSRFPYHIQSAFPHGRARQLACLALKNHSNLDEGAGHSLGYLSLTHRVSTTSGARKRDVDMFGD